MPPGRARAASADARAKSLHLRARGEDLLLEVQLSPRAGRDAILGVHDGALKVAVTAAPVQGAANAALCKLLAKTLRISKGSVRILQGESARRKLLALSGLSEAEV
ncbi:MAG: DUF167 family protein, partial [Myxococcales bacterium]|nr:DUF167 family protein [Myxococcales bacterium]